MRFPPLLPGPSLLVLHVKMSADSKLPGGKRPGEGRWDTQQRRLASEIPVIIRQRDGCLVVGNHVDDGLQHGLPACSSMKAHLCRYEEGLILLVLLEREELSADREW